MRAILSITVLATLLSSCGSGSAGANATLEADGRVDCRIGNDSQFQRYCSLERTAGAEGTILTLRKPDGGFRRLQVTTDGRGVIAADGAERAEVTIIGQNLIEVEIAGDRFRLPARIGSAPTPTDSNASVPAGNSL